MAAGPGNHAKRHVKLSHIPRLKASVASASGPQVGAPKAIGPPNAGILEVTVGEDKQAEAPIVRQLNAVRLARGLSSLAVSRRLTTAAVQHAQMLAAAGKFTHSWGDGTPFDHWILRYYPVARYRTWSAGENLLWASPAPTAEDAIAAWLASPTHRRIMLTPEWRELGIGAVNAKSAPGVFSGYDVQVVAAEFGLRR